jgi:SAM-dependent methyltransferase
MKNWFSSWFNTSYYHLLYKDRNEQEAQNFLSRLLEELKPESHTKFLDVACGKGRHSRYIHREGYRVNGIDLSPESIAAAKGYESHDLCFSVHDMREVFQANHYDIVLNLFTSFGYFDKESDHQKAIQAMADNLKEGGLLLIDFMNAKKVIANLVLEEEKVVEHITFHLKRYVKNGFIIKEIDFEDDGVQHHYEEKVRALTLIDFTEYLQKAGLNILNLWGDYQLNDFHAMESDRLIILAKK